MGLGERVRRWVDPPIEVAPDTWRLLVIVPFFEGPMLHSALEGAGVPAVMQEVRQFVGHDAPRAQIMVRESHRAEAEAILADLRAL